MTVRLKRGDTRTAIRATLIGPDGDPADLSSATRVRFLLADGRRELVMDREAEVIEAPVGRVLVTFEPGDTDRVGLFVAEFEVQWSDGRRETYPNGSYLHIEIIPDLG